MGKSLLKDSIQTIGNKFDNIFNQIERGTVILIGGNPGTGKTTMASKLSYDEINKRNGISMYVSLTETKEEYMKNMKKLDVDFESLEKSKRFYFIESITISDKNAVYDFLNQLLQYSDMYNATMIVIDSISSIFQVFRNISEVRELIHNFFYRISKLNKKTLVITEEIPYGSVGFGYGVEEFIVDLIIYLKMVNVKGKSIRIAEIKKFRGSDFQIAEMPFKIKPKQLISIPSFEFSGKGNQQEYIKINLGEKNVIEITKGSQNLIVINPRIDKESLTIFGTFGALIGTQYLTTGSGKTIFLYMIHS